MFRTKKNRFKQIAAGHALNQITECMSCCSQICIEYNVTEKCALADFILMSIWCLQDKWKS